MPRKRKYFLYGFGVLVLVALSAYYVLKLRTKSYSPEDTVTLVQEELELEVFYNRPSKNDRVIFGELVPYGDVWRTGANEATTFESNQDLLVDGSLLPAGKYTLWTIPMKDSWKIIFNSKMYDWGITMDGVPSRQAEFDVLQLELPVNTIPNTVEQFSIYFEEANDLILMILVWDRTEIRVPMKLSENQTSQVGGL